ncbi:transcriptional regulator [Alcanivorax sp. MD8A]|uniref:helix-turn-helix domain-containing protein n=1 Tax=Alcanivorax sp. MD8A TaxID=1177157 RepID=UPI000C9A5840|nr:AraC family transcriptional regulator [Alcanivorax sp. MD8A]MED5430830.1 AraC family transcriptional regulator [Pseudomonadota bacterium]PNE04347.1 transcriptional regulator [Alcanivorax sp. MD8A]
MQLLTGFSLGCLAVVFLVVLRDFRHLLVGKVFLWVLIAAAAFLLSRVAEPEFQWLLGDVMTTLPAAFWLLCLLAFSPKPEAKAHRAWVALALYSFIPPALSRPFGAADPDAAWWLHGLGFKIPQFAEYILILSGLWITAIHWRNDLVEGRRKLRIALLVSVGATLLCVTVSLNHGLDTSHLVAGMVGVATLLVGFLLLKGQEGVLLDLQKAPPVSASSDVEVLPGTAEAENHTQDETDEIAAQLKQIMEQEHFYRTEKLTLKKLADRMSLPEYRVRAIINGTFNYRNFNDYVNQMRIEEACDRLVSEPATPIQNIALDIGYRTLSSFNRAFKELTQQTPTEYRQSRQQA